MFDSVSATTSILSEQGYVVDTGLSTSLFLSLKMGKALFLEGEPGVGKNRSGQGAEYGIQYLLNSATVL